MSRHLRSTLSVLPAQVAAKSSSPLPTHEERLQEGTWANMVSNVRAGDKAQIRHQATRSAVGCSRPRWNCRPVALVSSCKPFLSTQQLPRHNATLKCSNVLCTNVPTHALAAEIATAAAHPCAARLYSTHPAAVIHRTMKWLRPVV